MDGYSSTKVLIGGLAHIPAIVGTFWVFDNRYKKAYYEQKAIEKAAIAKAKAEAEAKAKAAAEAKAEKDKQSKIPAEVKPITTDNQSVSESTKPAEE